MPQPELVTEQMCSLDFSPLVFSPASFLPPSRSFLSLASTAVPPADGRSREGAAGLGVFGVLGQGEGTIAPEISLGGARSGAGGDNPKINHVLSFVLLSAGCRELTMGCK